MKGRMKRSKWHLSLTSCRSVLAMEWLREVRVSLNFFSSTCSRSIMPSFLLTTTSTVSSGGKVMAVAPTFLHLFLPTKDPLHGEERRGICS